MNTNTRNDSHTSGGSGEAGIFIQSRTNYHKNVNVDELSNIVLPVCTKYNVKPPIFEIRPHRRHRWGCCYYRRNLIAFNIPIRLGNVYHELAHLISWKLYSCTGHSYNFKRILSDILRDNNI